MGFDIMQPYLQKFEDYSQSDGGCDGDVPYR